MSANDNAELISLTDLAFMSGIDEDTLLRRIAGILTVEDNGMPTCRLGDGPCRYPDQCYIAKRCLGAWG